METPFKPSFQVFRGFSWGVEGKPRRKPALVEVLKFSHCLGSVAILVKSLVPVFGQSTQEASLFPVMVFPK